MKVSVVIPVLNEQDTIAGVVRAVGEEQPHELVVIDADSTDDSARLAREAGATVLNWREVLPQIEPRPGKGESLWRGVAAASGDVVVFVDGDLREVPRGIIATLTAPFAEPSTVLVKSNYRRTLDGQASGGGRVTELTAKPLLKTFFPELSHINQPLAGEYAISRKAAVGLDFVEGYGVEAGLLIDVLREWGADALVEVELGQRKHRNRPLHELAPMAEVVARTILSRAGVIGPEAVQQRPALKGIFD